MSSNPFFFKHFSSKVCVLQTVCLHCFLQTLFSSQQVFFKHVFLQNLFPRISFIQIFPSKYFFFKTVFLHLFFNLFSSKLFFFKTCFFDFCFFTIVCTSICFLQNFVSVNRDGDRYGTGTERTRTRQNCWTLTRQGRKC